MAKFLKDKNIKYLNKDFDSFKRDLIRFSQAHHSGVLSDFNESSPGMALLEYNAYIGDTLAFYIDQVFSELKRETARQEKNVVSIAKGLGYRPKGKRAARGVLPFTIELPATTNAKGEVVPDNTYAPVLRKGARGITAQGVPFETVEPIFFSSSLGREVTGSQFNSSTGLPTYFAVRKSVPIIAGETKTDTVTITNFEQFKTIELSEEDVIEVISVVDSDGNEWVEVDYLAQDTVFDSDTNEASDNELVPYILKLLTVPRRFITDRNPVNNKTSLIFGSGDGVNFDDDLIPNLADLALPLQGKNTFTTFELDPQNFLKTRSLGLSPFSTTLTIQYRVGGGPETNVPPGAIKTVARAQMDFSSNSLDAQKKSDVESSIVCRNLVKTDGGGSRETITEIKANSAAYFASQRRAVTREDIISHVMSLPEKFGKPEKVFVKKNKSSGAALDIHILSKDSFGNLSNASQTLKLNIKNYLKKIRMLSDGINLLDTEIINLKIRFGVVVSSKANRSEVLIKCLDTVGDYFNIENQQIGQPIILSDLSAELQSVLGVVSVYDLNISNAIGTDSGFTYSNVRFDVRANTSNNIIYAPTNSIFEVKFPRRDIIGVVK